MNKSQILVIGDKSDRKKVIKTLKNFINDPIIETEMRFFDIISAIKNNADTNHKKSYWERYNNLLVVIPVEYKTYDNTIHYLKAIEGLIENHTIKQEVFKDYGSVVLMVVSLYGVIRDEFKEKYLVVENNTNALKEHIILTTGNCHLCITKEDMQEHFTKPEDLPALLANTERAYEILTNSFTRFSPGSLIIEYGPSTESFLKKLHKSSQFQWGFINCIVIADSVKKVKLPKAQNFFPYITTKKDFDNLLKQLKNEGSEQMFNNFGYG